jgi:ATP-binding cassette subfamily C (CFTR/MRP) protein 4
VTKKIIPYKMKEASISNETSTKKPAKRRQDSSFLAKWTFSYFNELAWRGSKKELDVEDIPLIEDIDKCEPLSKAINSEYLNCRKQGKGLWTALYRIYGTYYIIAGIFTFLEMLFMISLGFLLGSLLKWFQEARTDSTLGYYYASSIAFCSLSHGILHHVIFFMTLRLGMRIRIGLIAAIYQKCLSLPLANSQSSGLIVNLISNDVQRFEDLTPFGNFLWVVPLQIIISVVMIYREIGWICLAPMTALILLVPMQGVFGTKFGKFRKSAVEYRDGKIKSVSDMLAGIMVVKLYAWERPFMKAINLLRDLEMKWIWKGNRLKAVNEAIFFSSGSKIFLTLAFINLVTFMAFYFLGGELNPARVFSVFTYIQYLKLSVTNFFPKAIQLGFECQISVKRIEAFLDTVNTCTVKNEEVEAKILSDFDSDTIGVIIDGSFSWDSEVILSNICLTLKKKELTVICGPVGSGKSSALNVLLRNMTMTNGKFALSSTKIAYVSQSSWILSGSIKENILFGQPYNEAKFNRVIKACALEKDFSMFPNAENTILGERGVTLSGGQRARVSLARAVYYDAELYLLDDPLSAVDTKVGRYLFEKCIKGILSSKTIVLVTHQLQFISACDKVVIIENGHITASGIYNQIIDSPSEFAETIRCFNNNSRKNEDLNTVKNNEIIEEVVEDRPPEINSGDPQLNKEETASGTVPLSLYIRFFQAGSNNFVTMCMIFFIVLGQAAVMVSDYWLGVWSSESALKQREILYPIVYVSLAAFTVSISICRAILFFYICLKSTKASFGMMLKSVFRSPMSFFQSVPHGRLMNRFSKDISLMDEMLPQIFFDFVQCFFLTVGCILLAGVLLKYSLILIPFLLVGFYQLRKFYMKSSRQIKRLESITRSPVYSNISVTLEGLTIIRAFSTQDRFLKRFFSQQDENTRVFFSFLSASRWLGFRLDLIASFLVTIFAFVCVFWRASISASTTGLLLSYLLQLTGLIQWAIRQSAELENLMISTERVFEYAQLPSEAAEETDIKPAAGWPAEGRLEIKNMSLTYPNLENVGETTKPVLKNISISFEPGLKIGIVGRTGAGKSSFLQALFRMVEPSPEGCIVIDGIPTSKLGLYDLRSSLSIIPQEPFCFKGTLRFNLDPFNNYSDEQLWSVLAAVELKNTVMLSADKLDSEVTENGANWSVGERQLICLARSILRNSRIIVMDEATSSVDVHTDSLIQKAIRSKGGLFTNSTVLTIAHRLNTVIDYDRILVLDMGEIVEYGPPHELLSKDIGAPDAWFGRMVNELGKEAQTSLRKIANENRHRLHNMQ